MKLVVILFLIFFGCLEGPAGVQGPEGPRGRQGPKGDTDTVYVIDEGSKVFTETGILYANEKEDGTDYWDIVFIPLLLADSGIVQVVVRQGSGYMWVMPLWYFTTEGYVRIFDDATTSPGYEYRIKIMVK